MALDYQIIISRVNASRDALVVCQELEGVDSDLATLRRRLAQEAAVETLGNVIAQLEAELIK